VQSRFMQSFFALARPISIIVLCCVLCLNLALVIDGVINTPSSPNIIVIAVETLRAGHLGCYGYQRNTTPHIDALAQDSILFENAISVSSFTYPALSAFFTSQFPTVLGTTDFHVKLNNKFFTLAEFLKNNCYATAAFVANPSLNKKIGVNQGFGIYKMISGLGYGSSKVTDAAARFIRKNKKKPFFLFLFYFDPHHPYSLREEYNYYPSYKGALKSDTPISQYEYEKNKEKREALTDDDIKFLLSCYDSEIRYTDEQVGTLLNNLKTSGIYDNSIIILLGDHGEEFMDHGGMGHGHVLYQEIIHVPLIIKLALQQQKGKRISQRISLIDAMPSLAGLLKITVPPLAGLEGRQWDLEKIEHLNEEAVYSDHSDEKHSYCIIFKGLKLLVNRQKDGAFELYDLNRDPWERENIYGSAMEGMDALKDMLFGWRKHIETKKTSMVDSREKIIYNEKEKQQLRALGYLQ